jgi:hypothetical protein
MHATPEKRADLLAKIRKKKLGPMAEEHAKLVKVLDSKSRRDDRAEAKKQAAELEEYVAKGK